jgi:PAS domain S-box-containing protein
MIARRSGLQLEQNACVWEGDLEFGWRGVTVMSAAEPSFLFAMAAGGGLLLLGLLWQLLALRKSNERLEKTARERELVIDTLRGTESRFYELTETSPVGIFFSDLDGRRIFANHKLQQLSGHANDNPGLDSWLEALHPEDRDRVRHAWHQTLREDAPYLLEYRYVLPTGEVRWILGQATP